MGLYFVLKAFLESKKHHMMSIHADSFSRPAIKQVGGRFFFHFPTIYRLLFFVKCFYFLATLSNSLDFGYGLFNLGRCDNVTR